MSTGLLTARGHKIKKIDELTYTIEKDEAKGMRVPVVIYANANLISSIIKDRTLDQAVNVTTLPGVQKHVVVLPDGHEGYGFPVGGVAATDPEFGVISPGGVGYDINCGVRLVRTDLTEHDIKSKIHELIDELFAAIPSGLGSEGAMKLTKSELDDVMTEGVRWTIKEGYASEDDADACEENGYMPGACPTEISDTARKRGLKQLGSLGSGNHFLEVQKVDKIFDREAAEVMGITHEGQVTVLIHCGSRGFGHQICSDNLRICDRALQKYGIVLPDRELACVPYTSPEGESYMKAMRCALNFAWANRQMITYNTRKVFKKVFSLGEEGVENMQLVYDVAHNIAKLEKHKVDGEYSLKDVVVHRKGATRAFPKGTDEIPEKYRNLGQPVIIPGSMGTSSWLLLGNEKSMDLSFGSTAHGAGRMMSRSAAKREYSSEQVRKTLESKGVYVKSVTRAGMVEETPEAYKDVDVVADVSHRIGIATKVARFIPLGVIKG
jgi:tRNA-splicing ligase RtcB (3'-phosphate/5'-hydroxy nucleic acid ligase)